MTLTDLINAQRALLLQKEASYNDAEYRCKLIQADCEKKREPFREDPEWKAMQFARSNLSAEVKTMTERLEQLQREKEQDDAATRLAEQTSSTYARERAEGTHTPAAGGGQQAGEAQRSEAGGGGFIRTRDGRPATVARAQRFADHPVVKEASQARATADAAVIGQHGSFGQMVRAMSTSSGSAIVPTVWASDIIDRARNQAAVLRAGAQIVPMDAKTVNIGRLVTDPTAAFRAEGSPITASDPVFDNVTLTAKTQSVLVVGSLEWFQDADGADELVSNAIANAIANQLDLVALYGGITTGAGSINLPIADNPRGILATLNAVASTSVLGAATNGTTQTAGSFWNEVIDTVLTPTDYNEQPNALLWNSKASRTYGKAYDTTGQPLRMPPALEGIERLVTNQIPSYTQGTMTGVATDLFAGDFSQLLIGQRLGLTVQTLTERYAENGQIGIVAHWRGDIGLARPRAFAVYKALRGA